MKNFPLFDYSIEYSFDSSIQLILLSIVPFKSKASKLKLNQKLCSWNLNSDNGIYFTDNKRDNTKHPGEITNDEVAYYKQFEMFFSSLIYR